MVLFLFKKKNPVLWMELVGGLENFHIFNKREEIFYLL